MKKTSFILYVLLSLLALILLAVIYIAYKSWGTESEINAYHAQIVAAGQKHSMREYDPESISGLPEPVQRYFRFVFGDEKRLLPRSVSVRSEGRFRHPLMTNFDPATTHQSLLTNDPALMFDAVSEMPFGLWARAFDFYVEGNMVMQARVLSAVTVVNEVSTPELNKTSLQRWLLESSLNPAALLPGDYVRWEEVNDHQARAIVAAHGLEAALLATFRVDGSLETLAAEEDGDLSTPYHGSGEYVLREDYQLEHGMMIPMKFTIARSAGGRNYPFWAGQVTQISLSK